MTFLGVLLIVFVVLKLAGLVAWSWLWVLSPLWLAFVLWLAVIAGALTVFSSIVGIKAARGVRRRSF